MDIQRHINNAFEIVKTAPLVVIVGGLVVVALNMVSLGILTGPIVGGYLLMMIHQLRDKKQPDFNDLFLGFNNFGNLFLYLFVFIFIIIGFFFFVIPGLVMLTWWIYVLMLMADKKMPFTEAMTISKEKVMAEGFFMHAVFVFMISVVPSFLINFLTAIFPLFGLLQLVLLPFQCGCLVSLYLEQFEEQELDTPQTSSPPPPSTPKGVESTTKEPPPPPIQLAAALNISKVM